MKAHVLYFFGTIKWSVQSLFCSSLTCIWLPSITLYVWMPYSFTFIISSCIENICGHIRMCIDIGMWWPAVSLKLWYHFGCLLLPTNSPDIRSSYWIIISQIKTHIFSTQGHRYRTALDNLIYAHITYYVFSYFSLLHLHVMFSAHTSI